MDWHKEWYIFNWKNKTKTNKLTFKVQNSKCSKWYTDTAYYMLGTVACRWVRFIWMCKNSWVHKFLDKKFNGKKGHIHDWVEKEGPSIIAHARFWMKTWPHDAPSMSVTSINHSFPRALFSKSIYLWPIQLTVTNYSMCNMTTKHISSAQTHCDLTNYTLWFYI